jgi:predicted RNA-binding protein Jag
VKNRIKNASAEELLQMADEVPNVEEAIHAGAQRVNLPNLAMAVLDLASRKEGILSQQMAGHKQKIDEHKETMRSVIDLKTELQKLSEDEERVTLSDDIKQKILALRDKGIDLLPGSSLEKLSALELRGLKSRCKDSQDELQNAIQTILTTEVNVVIQFLNMLAHMMQKVTDLHNQGCATANKQTRV